MLIGNWLLRSGRGVESLFLFLWDFSLFGRSSRSLSLAYTRPRSTTHLLWWLLCVWRGFNHRIECSWYRDLQVSERVV